MSINAAKVDRMERKEVASKSIEVSLYMELAVLYIDVCRVDWKLLTSQ